MRGVVVIYLFVAGYSGGGRKVDGIDPISKHPTGCTVVNYFVPGKTIYFFLQSLRAITLEFSGLRLFGYKTNDDPCWARF